MDGRFRPARQTFSTLLREVLEGRCLKTLALRIGCEYATLQRARLGAATFPPELIAPLVEALGPDAGGRILSWLLAPIARVAVELPEVYAAPPVSSDAAIELDGVVTALELALAALARGQRLPGALCQRAELLARRDAVIAYLCWWVASVSAAPVCQCGRCAVLASRSKREVAA